MRNLWIAAGAAFALAAGGARADTLAVCSEASPDFLNSALPDSNTLELYDLDRAVLRHVTSELCDGVQHAWFLPDGAFVISGLARRSDSGFGYVLFKRDANGRERVLWRGDAWIAGFVPLDDHRMIVSTVSFQSSLELVLD